MIIRPWECSLQAWAKHSSFDLIPGWVIWPKDLLRNSTKWSPRTFGEISKSWEPKPNLLTFNNFELLGMTGQLLHIRVLGGQKHIFTQRECPLFPINMSPTLLGVSSSIKEEEGIFPGIATFHTSDYYPHHEKLGRFPPKLHDFQMKDPQDF